MLAQVLLSEESLNVHVIKMFYPYTGIKGGSVSTGSIIRNQKYKDTKILL